MTLDIQKIIAPAWATCEVCQCTCAGDEVEVCYIAEQPHYSHVDLLTCLARWEAQDADVSGTAAPSYEF